MKVGFGAFYGRNQTELDIKDRILLAEIKALSKQGGGGVAGNSVMTSAPLQIKDAILPKPECTM